MNKSYAIASCNAGGTSRHEFMSHVNESCQVAISHATGEWVMSHMNESRHERVMSHVNASCHIEMSHVTLK